MNSVQLMGRLCTRPEIEITPKGTKVSRVTLAVRKDKENTNFIPLKMWNKTAELVEKYKDKGDPLTVEGSLEVDQYEQGETRKYYTYVNVHRVYF